MKKQKDRNPGKHRRSRSLKKGARHAVALKTQTLKATVEKNRKGFAFLIFDKDELEDAFIPPRQADRLFHGDRVEVRVGARAGGRVHGDVRGASRAGARGNLKSRSSIQVEGLRVLEHRFRETVGRFFPNSRKSAKNGFEDGWVVFEKKKVREEIYIPKVPTKVAAGDWLKINLHFHEKGPFHVTGEVLEVYGQELPSSSDVGAVSAEYGLIEEHSSAAIQEAERLRAKKSDLAHGREDLRDLPLITIDGETARDFDDAVYVESTKNGYTLWVAIADVSHYVTSGSALDKEARSRGTSVYFPERAFHMLPGALSEDLCSLKPRVPRLALVAKIAFNEAGKRTGTQVMEAVIESKRRATYEEIQSEWDWNKGNKDWEFAPHFGLYEALRKMREQRGSINFDLPEAEVSVSPQGEVLYIRNRSRLDSHRLIEEFMIAANEAVTEWMMRKSWPFVYRIHEEPSFQSLEKFQSIAATVGVKVSLEKSSPKVMSDLIRRLEGHPAEALLNMSLLRSMKQAIYSSTHGIHYGLASPGYTHFTSPIRRYPDLVVHRLIRMVLQTKTKGKPPFHGDQRKKLEDELTDICEHCSYRERVATEAERESIKLKQVRLLAKHLGDELEGRIVGMIAAGVFVQINDPYVEGMVPVEMFSDEVFEFNEERMVFYGRRSKQTFKIGDKIRVRVVRADIERRQIDFARVK